MKQKVNFISKFSNFKLTKLIKLHVFSSKKHSYNNIFGTTNVQRPGASSVKNVTLIPGEGIGKELTECLLRVNSIIKPPIKWDIINDFTFENNNFKINDCILKGPNSLKKIYLNSKSNWIEEHVRFAKELGLFANVVHSYTIPGVHTRHKNLDIVVIRENTEGEFSGLEHEVYPGVIESIKVITKEASLRIAEYAFEYAYLNGRKKVTAVHKANIMKLCDGQFLAATREVARRYPNIKYEEMIIDNCCMQLISKPNQFDVMVLPNLYGGIVANITLGITGGPGLIPGAMVGDKYALFEVGGRHSAKDIEGKGIANPTAFLLSYSMLLRHLGLKHFADKLERGIYKTLSESNIKTPDIEGQSTSDEFTTEIINSLS